MLRYFQARSRAAASALPITLTAAVAAGMVAIPGASLQVRAQAAASQPASLELMNDLALAGAVNVCETVVESKIPVEKAVLSVAKAITYVVNTRYGGQVAGVGKLQPEQIANGTIIQVVGRIRQGCYDRLAGADKKFIDDVLSDINQAASQNQN